jgi:hypothetical protein
LRVAGFENYKHRKQKMTRTTFTIIFMVIAGIFLYAMAHFEKLDLVGKFGFILILAGYTAGQYSTKFPKEKE